VGPLARQVLCLHGYRQNADTFRAKTGNFRKKLKSHCTFGELPLSITYIPVKATPATHLIHVTHVRMSAIVAEFVTAPFDLAGPPDERSADAADALDGQ